MGKDRFSSCTVQVKAQSSVFFVFWVLFCFFAKWIYVFI